MAGNLLHMHDLISCEYTIQGMEILTSILTTDTYTIFKGELDLIIFQTFRYL